MSFPEVKIRKPVTYVLRVPLGTFGGGPSGMGDPKSPENWRPNPGLAMSADAQFVHNVDAGYLRVTPSVSGG